MHRFVWDLHYPPPDALERGYPISAVYGDTPRYPPGPEALPGVYQVTLTVDGRRFTQPLTLKMDPRVKTPAAGLKQQFELASSICEMMRQDYEALQQVRSLRAQLTTLRVSKGAPVDAIDALDRKAAAIEAGSGSLGRRSGSVAEASLTRLNSDLNRVLDVLDGADASPTTQAVAAVGRLAASLKSVLAQWNGLKIREVPPLNERLRQAAIPLLTP